MKTVLYLMLVSALIVMGGNLYAESTPSVSSTEGEELEAKANRTLKRSAIALENIMQDPENSIPPSLISQSEGIVIFPDAFKLALGVAGGQGGRGVAMIRQEDGSWSNPFFITLGEGSVGLQIGAQKSDIILLFRDRNDILDIDEAGVILGTGIGVAAGPESKELSAATDIHFETEIYSYQYSRGLFAGISLNGAILANSQGYNNSFYWDDNTNTDVIFNRMDTPYNDEVLVLIETLAMYGK
jgi:lipid-binding SYLF domain-containing protein